MVKMTAKTQREFAYGVRDGVRVSHREKLVLGLKNQIPNANFSRFEGDGDLRFYGAVKVAFQKRGRNVYVRRRGGRATKQNTRLVGLGLTELLIDDPLIDGEDLPSRGALENVVRASPAGVSAVDDTERGWPGGTYINGYCWLMGDIRKKSRRRFSAPSPPSDPFNLLAGGTYTQTLPARVPHESITGLAFLSTTPGGVYPRDAYVQAVIDVSDFMPESIRIGTNKLKRGSSNKPPASDQSFGGGAGVLGALETFFEDCPFGGTFDLIESALGWQFKTDNGWSAVQGQKALSFSKARKETALYAKPPALPKHSTHWRIVLGMADGRWYTAGNGEHGQADGALPKSVAARIYTARPDDWPDWAPLVNVGFENVDRTGIPQPEEKLEAPDLNAPARLPADRYDVFVTDAYDDGESRHSARRSAVTNGTQNLLIRLRDVETEGDGNLLANAGLAERTQADPANPSNWTRLIPLNCTAGEDGWEIRDARALAADQHYAASRRYPVNTDQSAPPMMLRCHVNMLRRVGGSAGLLVQFHDAAGAVIGTDAGGVRSTTGIVERSFGWAGSGATVEMPAGTASFTVRAAGTLSGSASVNLDADVVGMALYLGLSCPRVRVDDQTLRSSTLLPDGPVPLAEDFSLDYPESPYALVVKDYAGAGVNAIETWSPWSTPMNRESLVEDFEVVVAENTTYTLQLLVEGQGLPTGVRLFGGAFRDQDNKFIAQAPPIALAPDAQGNVSGVQSVTFTTPPGAKLWRVTYNVTGRGRLVVSKPQFERGAAATAWTIGLPPSGTVSQIFDLWCPGANALVGKNWIASSVKRVFDIVGRADEPANTSVAARLSFKDRLNDPEVSWGPAFSDPAAITYRDLRRFAKIEVTLNSADGIATPAVYEYGLEIEREAGVLLRGDGSEYYGGIIVDNMPAVSYPPNEQARRDRYGNPDFTELFGAQGSKELKGLRFIAFRRGGVQPAHHDAARGPRKFRIEINGFLYVIRILDLNFKIQGRETEDGFGVWIADNVDAQILKIRKLA